MRTPNEEDRKDEAKRLTAEARIAVSILVPMMDMDLGKCLSDGIEGSISRLSKNSKEIRGLRMAVRELRVDLKDCGSEVFNQFNLRLNEALGELAQKTAHEEARLLDEIRQRGRIANSDEFYLVRTRIDEIEGDAEHDAELQQLYRLIGAYERQGAEKAAEKKKSAKKNKPET